MKLPNDNKNKGFSLIELIVAMTVTLVLLMLVSTLLSGALSSRQRESRKNDALVASQAALNLMSREIANSGYGITTNGIVAADSNSQKIHFRANVDNSNQQTNSAGEDITYYHDTATQSILRFDRYGSQQTSLVINRIREMRFQYFSYSGSSTPTEQSVPNNQTGRIRISITVELENVQGQPENQTVILASDVMLKNSKYMLNQY